MDPLYLEALATLETANGRKTVKGPKGEDSFNLYNIKDLSGKGYRALDKAEGSNDAYRTYASRDEATADLIGLLSRKYPKALEAKSPQEFAVALKAGGYATDPAYVEKFVSVANSLAGTSDREPFNVPPAAAAPASRSLDDLYTAAAGPRPPRAARMTKTAAAVAELATIAPVRTGSAPDTEAAWFTRATSQEKDAEKAKREADSQRLIDIARANWVNGFLGTVAKRWSSPEYPADGFTPTEQDLTGYTVEEQDALKQATSFMEFHRIKFDIDYSREQQAESMKSGLGWAIAGSIVSGLPESAAAGFGTAAMLSRLGVGSVALAQAGRPVAAVGSAASENVGAGLAMTGVQDYLTPNVHLQDYVIGAVADLGVGVLPQIPRVLRASRDAEAKVLGRILDDAIDSKRADIDAARAKLGPDATPEEVGRAAAQAQAERIRTALATHTAELPADRRLIPDDVNEELMGEAPDTPGRGHEKGESPALYRGLAQPFEEAKRGDIEFWTPNLEHARTYGASVVTTSERPRNPRVVDEGQYNSEFLNAAYSDRNIDGVIVTRDGKEIIVATFNRPPAQPYQGSADLRALPQTVEADLQAAAKVRWDEPLFLEARADAARNNLSWRRAIAAVTDGRTFEEVHTLPAGTHTSRAVAADADMRPIVDALTALQREYLPNARVHIGSATSNPAAGGEVISVGSTHMIGLPKIANKTEALHTSVHELGHAVFHEHARYIPADLMQRIRRDFDDFLTKLRAQDPRAVDARFGITSPNAKAEKLPANKYTGSFDEYMAEQYVKHIEKRAMADDRRLTPTLRQRLVDAIKALFAMFKDAKAKALLNPDEGADEFFTRVLEGTLTSARKMETEYLAAELQIPGSFSMPVRTDADIARDYGLDTLAADSPAQRAELKAMLHLYRKAEAYPMPDEKRMSRLLSSAPLQAVAPTALLLMRSKNPVARMVAAELLESGGGAGGRRTTAAIAKWIHEREFMGNSINDFQRHYTTWRNANGGGLREDYFGGEKFEEFNRRVAAELENRKQGRVTSEAQAVRDAADVLTQAYERMRVTQQRLKTPGWASLPETSEGYMPHRMSPGKIRAMTPDQGRVLHQVLLDQFISIEGFDISFSAKLASKYIDIIRKRGTAGYHAPIGVAGTEAADIVEQAGQAMGMSRDEANALAKRVLRAQPAHTRHRLQLDLTQTYEADGKPFQLLDLFETNQLTLLRSQASRVSGEAALVKHGIMGSTGMKLIRRAMDFGTADGKAGNAELEAFDQVAAELLGQPFGKQAGKWLDRALQFNALSSLGGMGFNQIAETLNGAVTLGVRHALASVGSLRRLRSEILALSQGQSVNNPIIGSLETYGAEFGTDNYKLVFPFDNPDRLHEVYGVETLGAADRLLRSGSHLQGKLSLWRAISSTQERGMAEQIVHKALRYIRDGKDDVALSDMGIDRPLIDAIKAELPNVAKFDARGRLVEFDITKLENRQAADAFVQAVHRGTRQIIQGAFIGETGKWAHSGVLKLLTQFRTFSLIAIDKQWNRQVGNHGIAAALGILLGTMSFAAPIVMIRAGLQSIGRPDRDEYLERRLSPLNLARETLNYVALSGLSGDLLDALSALGGYSTTGGRTGTNKSFIGNVVAPAVGKVNDVWGAVQNSKDGTDIHGLAQQLPFARLPWLYPAVNALKDGSEP